MTTPERNMDGLRKFLKRMTLLTGLLLLTAPNSGCLYVGGFINQMFVISKFFVTTPLIPVSPFFSQEVEDTMYFEERYGRAPVLEPVEGENAPLFCMDPPTPDEVMRSMPDDTKGGWPFLAETQRNNVRIVVEPIVDSLGECRFVPMVGPARLHKCHYKCTVYFEKIKRSDWPIPFEHIDDTIEVVYIDHDHLIMCTGPDAGG